MLYTHRLATPKDTEPLTPFITELCREWAKVDPTRIVKKDFDFAQYTHYLLTKPHTYCIVLEHCPEDPADRTTLVGCILTSFYDEGLPPHAPPEQIQHEAIAHPFEPRRVGTVLGFYVHPDHRRATNVKRLINAAIAQADEQKIDAIDVQVFGNRTGVQALLKRMGFQSTANQYTLTWTLPLGTSLPNLHPSETYPNLAHSAPNVAAIPLRDPKTNQPILNPQGDLVYLHPLSDRGTPLLSSHNAPIYPVPVRDPRTEKWVFDRQGELVVCPVLRDESGAIVECNGIPQFASPAYELRQGELYLQQKPDGTYIFREVARDSLGKILTSPEGKPILQEAIAR
ncbi:MAG: GNAT family N-acetyltransferase [Cyanobacteria bacterium P01_E01_bin.42]